ncbi:MAG TPA: VOC family protein [Isosphaeraceae bacterium]|jgi:catechol 2,3-dioxygenase-like lactoylglutathione lyase family enzyme
MTPAETGGAPAIVTVVETAVYADDLDAARSFYGDVLGLEVIADESGRHVFFRAGDRVLLVFRPESTLKGDVLPAHGTTGPSHFALGIRRESLDDWRRRLAAHGVAVEQEVDWPRGGHSLYLRDRAGNLAELVAPGIWGLPDGW